MTVYLLFKAPKTIEDLIKLPERQMNILLREYGLPTKGKRAQKVTKLSQILKLEVGQEGFLDVLTIIRDLKTGMYLIQ